MSKYLFEKRKEAIENLLNEGYGLLEANEIVNGKAINHQEHKFTEGWTEKEDKKMKSYHECNWDDSCTMCHNYDDCVKDADEAREMNYLADMADKVDNQ